MDIMRLSGYIMDEKIKIAQQYLIPRNRKAMGLKAQDIDFSLSALKHMVNGYAREAGVRTFENLIKKIMRKVAVDVVKNQEEKPKKKKDTRIAHPITEKNLEKYLGKPVFTSDRFYPQTPVGVCMGLAWTSMGGATLYVEAIEFPAEKTEMKLTGQAGDVMKESSQIAWSFLQGSFQKYAPGKFFFDKRQVHVHIPEGATPKDGPSAGITMLTSLISLLRNEPVMQDLAMTGELTLTGKVLPIGGVKEKLIAARRSGVKILIFPKENKRDFDELPAYIKKGIHVHFVDHYDEVFRVVFKQ
jgi:ATP-dependent Lon protease